mmetsp:Transcript_19631/g.48856  ORF Transcript_19631/g.48856 Transcript_19631/m.48856 type:complete len:228 (-) Transcript_19631:181-864(-)
MPKLFKLLRNQKKRSSTPKGSKKNQGVFRSTPFRKKRKTAAEAPVIEAAITYTLSEDDDSCSNIILDDIENQFTAEELPVEDANDTIAFDTKAAVVADIEAPAAVETPKESSEDEETFTFSHLEIMRNELAHMMQIANKDKEIYQLKQDAEEIKTQHEEIVASKDAEIARIGAALQQVESALTLAQDKLVSEEMEHSKTIEVLMQTQYNLHELNNKSWFDQLTNGLF